MDWFNDLLQLLYDFEIPAMTNENAITRNLEIEKIREEIPLAKGARQRSLIARLGGLSGAGSTGRRIAAMKGGQTAARNRRAAAK